MLQPLETRPWRGPGIHRRRRLGKGLGISQQHHLLRAAFALELLEPLELVEPAVLVEPVVLRATHLRECVMAARSSEEADRYLNEATRSCFFGMFTACAVMCRSVLEEAIKQKLPAVLARQVRTHYSNAATPGNRLREVNENLALSAIDAEFPRLAKQINDSGQKAVHRGLLPEDEARDCLQSARRAQQLRLNCKAPHALYTEASMSYQAAIDQLHAMVPELYTAVGEPRRKFALDEIRVLLRTLGNPQGRLGSILIAGTNGKGSTAATLASILTASGVRTGLYTSPHLTRVNERIRVDGVEIADQDFARLYFKVAAAAQGLVHEGTLPQLPSFFEVLTAQALLHFAEAGVEIAVLEVGMGGRLDATNVVDPLLSIITDIALDHMEWLGSTLGAIAREKAGIMRRGGVLIVLPQDPEVDRALAEVETELAVRIVDASAYLPSPGAAAHGVYPVEALGAPIRVDSPLAGEHQHRNLALAIAAAVELAGSLASRITPASIQAGIRQTRWPARLEHLRRGDVEWILDVAHNPAGAAALRVALQRDLRPGRQRTLVFSCLRDKSVHEMSGILFPIFDRVIVAPIHSARAAAVADLEAAAAAVGVPAQPAESVAQALQMAEQRTPGGVAVVCGSVYLVGEARSLLLAGEAAP